MRGAAPGSRGETHPIRRPAVRGAPVIAKVPIVKDPNVVPVNAEQRDLIERLLQARIDGVPLVVPTKDIPNFLSPSVGAALDGAAPVVREDRPEPAGEIYLAEGESSVMLLDRILHRHRGPGTLFSIVAP